MKRKFFAAFLSLCMVMSLVPMTALAAEESWEEVSTAEGLSSALVTGGNIKLTKNITVMDAQAWTVGNGVKVVLDLNGYSITSTYNQGNYYLFTVNGGSLTLNDSSETRTGKIEIQNASQSYPLHLRGTGSNFIMNGGTITATEDALDISTFAQDTTITINGGTMSSQSYSALAIRGTNTVVNIDGGLIENNGHCGAFVSSSGSLDPNSIVFNMTDGKLTSTGTGILTDYALTVNIGEEAAIETAGTGISVKGTTVLNVDGGSITSGSYAIQANYNNTVNITGGKIQTTSTYAPAIQIGTDSNATISGGTITGKKVLAGDKEDITVTGGTFKDGETKVDVNTYFPEGAILTQDPTGAVTPKAPGDGETVIAEVNSVPYNSIKNAINAAQDGDTVVLKATSTKNESIVISDGRSITLDMNGFDIGFAKQKNISLYHGKLNITGKGMLYEESPWFGPVMIYGAEENVSNYSVVTIGEDVTLRGWSGLFIDQHNAHGAQAYGIEATVYGTLESVKDTSGAGGHALYINGTIKETTGNVPKITLNGATLTTELGNGMYLAGYADTTIVDSTITSIGKDSTGIEIRAGKLTIKGNTTVTASQGEVEVLPNGNGSTSANVALAVAQHTTKLPIELTVTGGTFIGGAALNEMNPQKNNPEDIARVSLKVSGGEFIGIINSEDFAEFITGGHFSSPVDQDYLETDLTAELYSLRNTATPYSYYPSVEEAQAAAQPGDVVTDLSTVKEDAKQFTITFDYGDGTKKTVELWEGAETTLPTLNDRGYNHFVGWSDQAGNHYNGGQTVKITVDMTFTAQWTYIPPANPNYQIAIGDFANGTVTANPTAAKAGATVTLTPVPDEGYALSTLTVTDRFGDAVRVTEQADGTYTFTMPNGQVTVTATFVETEEPVDEPFVDVAEGDWFYDAVVYAYQNELMDGVGGNRFAPNSETTRAQLVTILYRLEGQPAVSGDLPFTDVESGTWYTDAILWAAQNNIVNGVNDTEFAPGDDLTRQQLVTILYRYAEAKGYDVSASADLSGYPDAGQVQAYAQPAMAWAVAENIIQGMEDGTLKPAGNASRAQIATILMRFCEDVAQ